MEQSPAMQYTGAELAQALGLSKRAVLLALRDVPATGARSVRGQAAGTWKLLALSAAMLEKLESAASRQNFRDAVALLTHCATSEVPPLAAPAEKPELEIVRELRATVTDAIAVLADPENPSARDREYFWGEICGRFEQLNLDVNEGAAVKDSLVTWLNGQLPKLATSPASLRRNFERKLAAFKTNGFSALADGRSQRSGHYRPSLCPSCWENAIKLDARVNGSESLAWRRLKLQGLLCPDCDAIHKFDVRNAKSRVPSSIRGGLTRIVNKALTFAKSDSAGRMAGPKTSPRWPDVAPGEFFLADDVTFNHVVWTADARGVPYLCQPECLYMEDARTSYPIHFLLIAGAPGRKACYNATHVRQLMLGAHDKLGLPHRGYKFENGVWRAREARDEQVGAGFMPWTETVLGLRSLQDFVTIEHTKARTPTGKATIEGNFRILQERMRTEPGFVGFNQRAEKSDRMKRLERDFAKRVKAGQEHPGNEFLSLGQWKTRLEEIFVEFANEPQNGKRFPGQSPAEAWGEPTLRKLPDEARWILATHRGFQKVTDRGLVIKDRDYANGNLARYIGRKVWWFSNIECPELLTVCDEKRTDFFPVVHYSPPAMKAGDTAEGRETLRLSQRQIDDFNRPAKVIAGSIHHPRVNTIVRDGDVGEADRQFGLANNKQISEHRQAQHRVTDARVKERKEGLRMIAEARMEGEANNS